jgi:hypothetical protein
MCIDVSNTRRGSTQLETGRVALVRLFTSQISVFQSLRLDTNVAPCINVLGVQSASQSRYQTARVSAADL